MFARLLITLVLCFTHLFSASSHLNESATLYQLLDDMKCYKFHVSNPLNRHAGDLFQHSMWVYFAAIDFVEYGSVYSANIKLSEREKDIFYVAALLHDIGKAGRKELFDKTHPSLAYYVNKDNQNNVISIDYFPDKEEHCNVAFECLTAPFLAQNQSVYKPRFYVLKDGKTTFDLDQLFAEMGITSDERKEIAIIAGMHWSFGNFRRGLMSAKSFIEKIKALADACGYTLGVSKKLLQLCVLIQVADVKGLHPVPAQKSVFLTKEFLPADLAPVRPLCQPCPFEEFGYYHPTKKALAMYRLEELQAFFDSYQQHDRLLDMSRIALLN